MSRIKIILFKGHKFKSETDHFCDDAMDLIRNDVTNKDGRDSWGTLYSQWWERLAFAMIAIKKFSEKAGEGY